MVRARDISASLALSSAEGIPIREQGKEKARPDSSKYQEGCQTPRLYFPPSGPVNTTHVGVCAANSCRSGPGVVLRSTPACSPWHRLC
jgi:hypothetical protein